MLDLEWKCTAPFSLLQALNASDMARKHWNDSVSYAAQIVGYYYDGTGCENNCTFKTVQLIVLDEAVQ